MQEIDGKEMGGARLEVSLAKPPSDKKKKEEILRARERRMTQMIYGRGGYVDAHETFTFPMRLTRKLPMRAAAILMTSALDGRFETVPLTSKPCERLVLFVHLF